MCMHSLPRGLPFHRDNTKVSANQGKRKDVVKDKEITKCLHGKALQLNTGVKAHSVFFKAVLYSVFD